MSDPDAWDAWQSDCVAAFLSAPPVTADGAPASPAGATAATVSNTSRSGGGPIVNISADVKVHRSCEELQRFVLALAGSRKWAMVS